MNIVNLAEGDRSVSELIEIAKSGPVLVHAVDGTDFVLEEADAFEREAAMLGASDGFKSFLQQRSREGEEISASEVAKRLGIDAEAK
ncbi:MAG TPA: hypothetical protein PKI11_08410 [Candidatus Hydrogenedentes bacterium]|nr:hypothetical protein [Candidatus Hydrogenedentota bacterium]